MVLLTVGRAPRGPNSMTKIQAAHHMLKTTPSKWLGHGPVDPRDLDLIDAPKLDFVDYGRNCFLRKVNHSKTGDDFGQTEWTVENDLDCKKMVDQAGGQLVGFQELQPIPVKKWANVNINVNLYYKVSKLPSPGSDWGYLANFAKDTRIFKGPSETCSHHPWDAMIMRNCTSNTSGTSQYIKDRAYDLLLFKMCEDYDCPWILAAIKEVPNDFEVPCSAGCVHTDGTVSDGKHSHKNGGSFVAPSAR